MCSSVLVGAFGSLTYKLIHGVISNQFTIAKRVPEVTGCTLCGYLMSEGKISMWSVAGFIFVSGILSFVFPVLE